MESTEPVPVALVTIRWEDGSQYTFDPQPDGSWTAVWTKPGEELEVQPKFPGPDIMQLMSLQFGTDIDEHPTAPI